MARRCIRCQRRAFSFLDPATAFSEHQSFPGQRYAQCANRSYVSGRKLSGRATRTCLQTSNRPTGGPERNTKFFRHANSRKVRDSFTCKTECCLLIRRWSYLSCPLPHATYDENSENNISTITGAFRKGIEANVGLGPSSSLSPLRPGLWNQPNIPGRWA